MLRILSAILGDGIWNRRVRWSELGTEVLSELCVTELWKTWTEIIISVKSNESSLQLLCSKAYFARPGSCLKRDIIMIDGQFSNIR